MRLDYFTLLCDKPINISIGRLKAPTLDDIGNITFTVFGKYTVYLKLTPSEYYKTINKEQKELFWDYLTEEQQDGFSLYDLILVEDDVRDTFVEIFNFFFIEKIIFRDNLFYIVNVDKESPDDLELTVDNVIGVINPANILDVVDLIQQICCLKSDDPLDEVKPKFKNKKAEMLYQRMLKAKQEQEEQAAKKNSVNMQLANIISATAAKTPGLNIINIWQLTIFQLYDQFGKIQNDDIHYMNSVRVAVWGDENKQFDPSLWYKNNYNKERKNDLI